MNKDFPRAIACRPLRERQGRSKKHVHGARMVAVVPVGYLGHLNTDGPKVIAQSMGVNKAKVHQYLREAPIILRQAFNQDGKLFLTR